MSNVHGEAEDYIGPSETGHEHDLSRLEEPTTEEAEEYVGPHVAKDVEDPAPAGDSHPEADESVKDAADHMKAWFRQKEHGRA
ncbi:MAG TPA: hypothetical protein VGH94_03985 [Acidimicrobiales bacterium]